MCRPVQTAHVAKQPDHRVLNRRPMSLPSSLPSLSPRKPTMPARPVDVQLLQQLAPLNQLADERLAELCGHCRCIDQPRGPIDLGGDQTAAGPLIYLLSGELRVEFTDGSSRLLVGCSEDINLPLTRMEAPLRRARAITPIRLLCLDEDVVDLMLTWDQMAHLGTTPPSGEEAAGSRTRIEAEAGTEASSAPFPLALLTSDAFKRLPVARIGEFLAQFRSIPVQAGETILREGEPGNDYYLIESGRYVVTREVGGSPIELAQLTKGDAFGEEALLGHCQRNATVTAISPGRLLRLPQPAFEALLVEPLLQRVSRESAESHLTTGACWIDVRYPAEYQVDRIPGAINIPLNEIRNAIDILDRKREYLVYCQSGRRSAAAAFLLARAGYQVRLLEHGLRGLLPATSPPPPSADQDPHHG